MNINIVIISDNMLNILQALGTVAFAVSGALVAGRRKMDWFGVMVLAVMVAVGGGSLRDMLLGVMPVFWVESPWFVLLAILTALVTIPIARSGFNPRHALILSDAIGLAVFAILGTEKSLDNGANMFVAIILGIITGTFGGVLRDVLANRDPSILYGDIYALAAMAGCTLFVLLMQTAIPSLYALWISIGVVLVLRLIAIARNWSIPEFRLKDGAT